MKRSAFFAFSLLLALLFLAGCVATNAQPGYPGGGLPPPPANVPLAAVDALNNSLQNMFAVVGQYGPGSYGELRREMTDMGLQINDVGDRLRRNERPAAVRASYTNVQRAASVVDARMRSINADPPVRQSWNNVTANLQYTTSVMDRMNGNPGPLPPAPPPLPNAAIVRAGDDLVGSIDAYLRSIAPAQRQEALDLKSSLNTMRAAADSFRNSARAGTPSVALRPPAADLLARFNAANQIYTNLVAADRRFNSPLFGKIAEATSRVQQSVR